MPMPVTLESGHTLYMRYAVLNPSRIQPGFNTVDPDVRFDGERNATFTYKWDFYNDSDGMVVATTGVRTATFVPSLGFGPSVSDSSRGGNPEASFYGRLDSYADGSGLMGLTWFAGEPAHFATFDVVYMRLTGGNGIGVSLPFAFDYAVDEIPPVLPEPTSFCFAIVIGGFASSRRRRPART